MASRHLKCHRVAGGEKTDSGPAEGGAERTFLRELALDFHFTNSKQNFEPQKHIDVECWATLRSPGNDKKIKATTSSIESLQILEVPTTQRGRL
jgi:hypothetical protein